MNVMQNILTVSQLNRYIGAVIGEDERLSDVIIKGEISNFTNHYKTGHFFFVLKDDKAAVKVVMFQSYASQVPFKPQNGMNVLIRGGVRVFERDGIYQLYAYEMQPDGVGAMALAFMQLKEKLYEEGLFEESHKIELPSMPKNIAVITSKTGAVFHDILHVLKDRYPIAHVYLYPVQVQGDQAPAQMTAALKQLQLHSNIDVIILARGGGSLEELWAFNDEKLARAVYDCKIPVVSAVGHETDFTICDFVSDLRCATPTAAASAVTPDITQIYWQLLRLFQQIEDRVNMQIEELQCRLNWMKENNFLKNNNFFLDKNRQRLVFLIKFINSNMQSRLDGYSNSFLKLHTAMQLADPLRPLTQGYAVVQKKRKTIQSVRDLSTGDELTIRFADGSASASVTCILTKREDSEEDSEKESEPCHQKI